MSEYEDEREVARRYRELPREEPPAGLDAAIRAAARARASRRGLRLWYFPAAAAAIVVLAVAVAWQVERNKPEFIVASGPAESKLRKEQVAPAPPSVAEPKGEAKPEPRAFARSKTQQAPAASADQASPRPLGSLNLDEAPEPWLKRIAELRRQGRHDEADQALAEFRKRYPAYTIAPGMLEKVERK
jgi:hypothetical protein